MEDRQPYGMTVFCDDIRHEITGQVNYIGCYQGAIFVPSFPISLPKFAFGIWLYEPKELATKRTFGIPIQIYLPGDPDSEPAIAGEIPSSNPNQPSVTTALRLPEDPDVPPYIVANIAIVLAGLQLRERGRIKVRANYDGQTVRLGTIAVASNPTITAAATTNAG